MENFAQTSRLLLMVIKGSINNTPKHGENFRIGIRHQMADMGEIAYQPYLDSIEFCNTAKELLDAEEGFEKVMPAESFDPTIIDLLDRVVKGQKRVTRYTHKQILETPQKTDLGVRSLMRDLG